MQKVETGDLHHQSPLSNHAVEEHHTVAVNLSNYHFQSRSAPEDDVDDDDYLPTNAHTKALIQYN